MRRVIKSCIYWVIKIVEPMRQDITKATMDNLKKKHQASFRRWLVGKSGGNTIIPYIGASREFVIKWLEDRFLVGMSWGTYGEIWVVDHVIPLRLFDMTNEEDLKISLHYKNLMPLYKQDNMYKDGAIEFSARVIDCLPKCDISEKLQAKIEVERHRLNKYIYVLKQ